MSIGHYGEILSAAWGQVRGQLSPDSDPLERYRGREVDFAREVLRQRLWAGQVGIMEALLRHRFVSVRGCRKASKTHTAAAVLESFMQCGPTIALTTAPSRVQVETQLWSRINQMHAGASVPLRGEIGVKQLKIDPGRYALGFATNTADRVQGFHAGVSPPEDPDADDDALDDPEKAFGEAKIAAKKASNATRLLFIFDEAAGVPQFVFEAARGSFLGDNVYVLMQANPTISIHEPHDYARSHLPGTHYHRIKIAGKKSDDPVECDQEFITPHWLCDIRDLEREYPADDPYTHDPYVLAKFREGDASGRIITYAQLAEADCDEELDEDGDLVERWVRRGAHVGFDTAWKGDDLNVACLWVDSVKVSEHHWRSQDSIASWERLKRLVDYWRDTLKLEIPWSHVHIDDAPVAAGIIDTAKRERCLMDRVEFGGAPTNAWADLVGGVKFKNRRAEMYWVLSKLLARRMARLPKKYEASWQELAATQYSFTTGLNELVIEPKENIKKRLGRSPDHADADVLAFAKPRGFKAWRMQ